VARVNVNALFHHGGHAHSSWSWIFLAPSGGERCLLGKCRRLLASAIHFVVDKVMDVFVGNIAGDGVRDGQFSHADSAHGKFARA
jgi:hypothetical protein